MVRRRISEAQRWQIIGMHTTGMSFKAIGRKMGYHYTVVSRLVRKHTQTNNVKDLPRSGRSRVTSDRDDRALQRLVRRMPFATSPVLKQHWLPNKTSTVGRPTSTYACRLFAIFVLLIFAFVPCLLRMNNLFKTPDLNTQIRSVNILNSE
jgi:IS30 family transposase